MSAQLVAVLAVVLVAMAFDYTNGFHDAANAIATSVSTRALTPRVALLMAAVGNFVGAHLGGSVAKTVGSGLVVLPPGLVSLALNPEDVVGRGTGIDGAGLERKREAVRRYGAVAPDLFDAIVNRCVDQGKMCLREMMAMDAHRPSGRQSAREPIALNLGLDAAVCRADNSAASPGVKPSRARRRRRPSSIWAVSAWTRSQPAAMAIGSHEPAARTTRAS